MLFLPYPQFRVLPDFDGFYHLSGPCARATATRVFCWLSHQTAHAKGYKPCPHCCHILTLLRPQPPA